MHNRFGTLSICGIALLTLVMQTSIDASAIGNQNGFPDLYQYALLHNPELNVLQKSLGVSEQDITIAGYIPNPYIQATGTWGKMTTEMGNPHQIGVVQTLELGVKRKYRILQAKAKLTGAQISIRQFAWQMRSDLRLAYLDYLAVLAQQDQLRQQQHLFEQLVHIAEARSNAGASPEAEAIQARLALMQLDPKWIQAEGQLVQKKLKMAQLSGQSPDVGMQIPDAELSLMERVPYWPFSVDNTITPEALSALRVHSHKHRQDLIAALNQLEQGRLQLKAAQAARVPDLQLGAGMLFVHTMTPLATSTSDKGNFTGGYATLGLTVPIFHNQRGEIRQGKAQMIVNQASIASTEFAIDSGLVQVVENIKAQQRALETFRQKLLPAALDVLRLSDKGYRYGKTGLANVILARQSYQAIQSDYRDTLLQTWQAWANLEQATGMPFEVLFKELGWTLTIPEYQPPQIPLSQAMAIPEPVPSQPAGNAIPTVSSKAEETKKEPIHTASELKMKPNMMIGMHHHSSPTVAKSNGARGQ